MPLYFFLGAKIRFLFELSKTFRKFSFFLSGEKQSLFYLTFLRPDGSKRQSRAASGKAERSGAENEALSSYFLRREERSKEASTLTKPSPIWEGCN